MNFTQLTFPVLYKNNLPTILLISENPISSKFYKILTGITECLTENHQCSYLNTQIETEVTLRMLEMWNLAAPKKDKDALLYIDFQRGAIYSYKDDPIQIHVDRWIKKVILGKVIEPLVTMAKPKSVERPLMFDYLDLIYQSSTVEVEETMQIVEQKIMDKDKTAKVQLKGPEKIRSRTEL